MNPLKTPLPPPFKMGKKWDINRPTPRWGSGDVSDEMSHFEPLKQLFPLRLSRRNQSQLSICFEALQPTNLSPFLLVGLPPRGARTPLGGNTTPVVCCSAAASHSRSKMLHLSRDERKNPRRRSGFGDAVSTSIVSLPPATDSYVEQNKRIDRNKQRQRNKQAKKQTDRETDKETDMRRNTDKQRNTNNKNNETDRQREKDKQQNRHRNRTRQRQRNRQTTKQTEETRK